jgi:hypothetical protein
MVSKSMDLFPCQKLPKPDFFSEMKIEGFEKQIFILQV